MHDLNTIETSTKNIHILPISDDMKKSMKFGILRREYSLITSTPCREHTSCARNIRDVV